jgi:hypothetical protein
MAAILAQVGIFDYMPGSWAELPGCGLSAEERRALCSLEPTLPRRPSWSASM